MVMIETTLALLMALEGFSNCAYPDGPQYSIGYGTKAYSKFECISEEEAKRRLTERVFKDSKYVLRIFPRAAQTEHDALVSYCYNRGQAGCKKALEYAAKGQKNKASWVMRQEINIGQKSELGLRNRRAKEVALLTKPVTYTEWYMKGFNSNDRT